MMLAGCVGAPIESARIVPQDAATVSDRIRAAMLSLGLTPTTGQDQALNRHGDPCAGRLGGMWDRVG